MPRLPKNFDMEWWPHPRPARVPRSGLRGGYVCDWARRNVTDIPKSQASDDDTFVLTAIRYFRMRFESVMPDFDLTAVGEVIGGDGELMVHSHYLRFADGYLGMDHKDYPKHFEEDSLDREAKAKLEQELGVKLEFVTRLG